MNNRTLKKVVTMLFCTCVVFFMYISHIQASEESVFYLSSKNNMEGTLPDISNLAVASEYYSRFLSYDLTESTAECPRLDMYIKYVESDGNWVDDEEKYRYVYSLDGFKENPQVGTELFSSGWTNKEITYVLYHGAVYYKEFCRNTNYSTGYWQMDYFVTQMAIYILNDEFTLEAFSNAISENCDASQMEKNRALSSVKMLVEDAKDSEKYAGFSSDGWVDLSQGEFLLDGYSKEWKYNYTSYDSKRAFQTQMNSYDGYDFREQIQNYTIDVPIGVEVVRLNEKIYADFKLKIAYEQFLRWQATGFMVPINIEISLMTYWGGKLFSPVEGMDVQRLCMFAGRENGGETTFSEEIEIPIERVIFSRDLTIQKKLIVSEVNWEHGNPIFFFTLLGTDVRGNPKKYQTFIEISKEKVAQQSGNYYIVETTIKNIASGVYMLQENDCMRYVLTNVESLSDNVTVEKRDLKTVNGVTKIETDIVVDLVYENGNVSFLSQKVLYDKFSDNAVVRNSFVVPR